MMHYGYYADVPDGAIDDLVARTALGRLVTTAGAQPHIGLYPFVPVEGGFELHLHRKDEQVADLRASATCLLALDQPLSVIPSYWIDPHDASFASAFHRSVTFECAATLVDDPVAIAAQQARLMARYQPEARHAPVDAADPVHATMLKILVGVRLEVRATKVKFKLAQNRDLDTRARIVERLRERGGPLDRETADALQGTIELGWTTRGRALGAPEG